MKIIKWCDDHLEELLLAIILFTISFMVILQVFMRYVVGSSLAWTEESVRFLFIWMVFLGFSLGVKKNNHLAIKIFDRYLPQKVLLWLVLFGHLCFLIFCLIISILGFKELMIFMEFKQVSPAMGIPMSIVYAAAPIGLILTSIRLIQNVIQIWKKGEIKAFGDSI